MTFKKQLSHHLKRRQISAAELARRTGVPKQTISDWLGGTQPRKVEFVKRIADELNVTIIELFFGNQQDFPTEQNQIYAIESYAQQPIERDFILSLFAEYAKDLEKTKRRDLSANNESLALLQQGTGFFFRHSKQLLQILNLMNGYPLELSPSWESTLGWSMRELKAKRWIEWIHPNDQAQTIKAIENHMTDGSSSVTCRHRLLKKNAQLLSCETTITVDIGKRILFSATSILESYNQE
jgi:transcriptional regulator with XRE-family HTH domain